MIDVIFTLDYEIHGNGDGDPFALMVEPTQRLLDQFDRYGAKLTILADVAEILRFKEYAGIHAEDRFHYAAIERQLCDALRRGHDVQLHLHSSYFNARFEDGRWAQDYSEYNLAALPADRLARYLQRGKDYLETLLRSVRPDYHCCAFRAANWALQPSATLVPALIQAGIRIDSSIFKYGSQTGLVAFDYAGAHSDAIPWRCSAQDACLRDPASALWEVPIYSENRSILAFFSLGRFYRAAFSRKHPLDPAAGAGNGSLAVPSDPARRIKDRLVACLSRHAWKADFNQCTGRQLIGALRRVQAKYGERHYPVPFTLIGHSKLVTRANQNSLDVFLRHVARDGSRYRFASLGALSCALFEPRAEAARGATSARYVLITPTKNEAALIQQTLDSVIAQTIRPVEWIVVDDGSTDRTGDLVRAAAIRHPWIRLVTCPPRADRCFGAVVRAVEAGVQALTTGDYDYLGLLDSDVRFAPDYFQRVIEAFAGAPGLGLAGGRVLDPGVPRDHIPRNRVDIPGAAQFFRRSCFESLGGLVAIPEGGWDVLTCAVARLRGYETRLLTDLVVDHLKPRNIYSGGALQRHWQMGVREYALGYDPLFELFKCFARLHERPLILGSIARAASYYLALCRRRPRLISNDLLAHLRREQRDRLRRTALALFRVHN